MKPAKAYRVALVIGAMAFITSTIVIAPPFVSAVTSLNGTLARAEGSELKTKFAPICAEREAQAITVIDRHGEAQDVPPERLAEAGLTMLDARLMCYADRVSEAVALYDRAISLGSMAFTGR